jgi:hypothetical protein
MRHARKRSNIRLTNDPATERLIRTLVDGCGSPARALELYYWCREPGLIEIVRAIASMSEETRAVIEAFVALASNANSVKAELNSHGVLTLVSTEAARIVAIAQYAAEDESEDAPRLLN